MLEGSTLRHISKYGQVVGYAYNDPKYPIYSIPLELIHNKQLYRFSFTRSGGAFSYVVKAEDFDENGHLKRYQSLSKDKLRGLSFEVESADLKIHLSQFDREYIPMIKDLKIYGELLNFDYSFMGHEERLEEVFKDPVDWYFSFMALPKDSSRLFSLKNTRGWVYHLWVLKLVCEAIGTRKFIECAYRGKPYWWIEQGSELSTAIAETALGPVTLWLEFQPHRMAHMVRMFKAEEKRAAVRPDIVAVKGIFRWTSEFIESRKQIDLLIECKEDPFYEWEKDVESQIRPYLANFNPRRFLLVSFELVPPYIKNQLRKEGITVIDKLKIGSDSINLFKSEAAAALTSP